MQAATEDRIAEIVRLRCKRAEVFGDELFSDPAWDILLALYAASLAGSTMTFDQLSIVTPPSTLARWLAVLQERGLLSCELAATICPDLVIALSDDGVAGMATLFQDSHLACVIA